MTTAQNNPPLLRRAIFGVLAAFILLTPAFPQVLGVYPPVFRAWVMYSAVGLGILRGEVVVTSVDGVKTMAPEKFLGVAFYPQTMSLNDWHVILDETALSSRMAAYCEAQTGVVGVSFDGEVSDLNGWRSISVEKACQQ